MIGEEIYWKLDGGGFYLLTEETAGYIYIGMDEHRRIMDEVARTGFIIKYDSKSGQLILVNPYPEDPEPEAPKDGLI